MQWGRILFGLGVAASIAGCGDDSGEASGGGSPAASATTTSVGAPTASTGSAGDGGGPSSGPGGGSSSSSPTSSGTGGEARLPDSVTVTLVDNGAGGVTRVSFAVPLGAGQLDDASQVRVLDAAGAEVAAARRGIAARDDGSFRSVQLQVDVDPAASATLTVEIGAAPAAGELDLVDVATTLVDPDGQAGPRVWALLPASWLSASGVAGPLVPDDAVTDARAETWAVLCDPDTFGSDAFFGEDYEADRAVWLYDRGTALYRSYARRGDLSPLASAYVETSFYRNRITGAGTSARNGAPAGGSDDPKYQYAQNLAIHYLLTGDDRFQSAAEDMALGMTELWPDPGYAGGDDQWTERNAGFSLLAYVWGATVAGPRQAEILAAAGEAFLETLHVQATYPEGYDDDTHRCFAHHGDAHDPEEQNPYFGCSPWMSAILADGLDGYRRMQGGDTAELARGSLVQLGRALAQGGRDEGDRPYYWMGVGTEENAADDYDEHIGESAYVVALARALAGEQDAELDGALDALLDKLAADAEIGQLRSYNWQCRSAVMTPTFLP